LKEKIAKGDMGFFTEIFNLAKSGCFYVISPLVKRGKQFIVYAFQRGDIAYPVQNGRRYLNFDNRQLQASSRKSAKNVCTFPIIQQNLLRKGNFSRVYRVRAEKSTVSATGSRLGFPARTPGCPVLYNIYVVYLYENAVYICNFSGHSGEKGSARERARD
jgi:hypothetical protein